MTNWVLTHCVGSVRKVSFKFPENFIVKSRQNVKLWASSRNAIANNSSSKNNNNTKSVYLDSTPKSPTLNGKHVNGNNGSNTNFKTNGYHHLNGSNGNYSHNNNISNNSSNKDFFISPLLSFSAEISSSLTDLNESVENELVLYDIENWTCGAQEMFIRLENEFGEEKALFRKTN
jgi:hypothetical protein